MSVVVFVPRMNQLLKEWLASSSNLTKLIVSSGFTSFLIILVDLISHASIWTQYFHFVAFGAALLVAAGATGKTWQDDQEESETSVTKGNARTETSPAVIYIYNISVCILYILYISNIMHMYKRQLRTYADRREKK